MGRLVSQTEKKKIKRNDSVTGFQAKKGAVSIREEQKEVQPESESSMEEEDCINGSWPHTDSQLSVKSQQEEKHEKSV